MYIYTYTRRSHLPSSSVRAAAADTPLSPTDTSAPSRNPLYLPTTENSDAYKLVTMERMVVKAPPPKPIKDAKTIEAEV